MRSRKAKGLCQLRGRHISNERKVNPPDPKPLRAMAALARKLKYKEEQIRADEITWPDNDVEL